jgi:hypothetical protein
LLCAAQAGLFRSEGMWGAGAAPGAQDAQRGRLGAGERGYIERIKDEAGPSERLGGFSSASLVTPARLPRPPAPAAARHPRARAGGRSQSRPQDMKATILTRGARVDPPARTLHGVHFTRCALYTVCTLHGVHFTRCALYT